MRFTCDRGNLILMGTPDLTIKILTSIRDEVRKTNTSVDETNKRLDALRESLTKRIDSTNERIDSTNERIDDLREVLSKRIVESEIRTSTAIADLAGSIQDLTALLRKQADPRPRVGRCEHEIAKIKARLKSA